jgi:hypothetical protein
VGDGSSILFWCDLWKDNTLDVKFQRLFSFTKDKLISVKEFFARNGMSDLFHLPLSTQAHSEYLQLQELMAEIEVSD